MNDNTSVTLEQTVNTNIEQIRPVSATHIRGNNHLRIYVLPCDKHGNEWYFLPQFVKSPPGRLEKFQNKQTLKLRNAKPDSKKGKMWAKHEKSVAKEPSSKKMVKRLPNKVTSIEFIYPSNLNVEDLLEIMKSQAKKEGKSKRNAAIGFGIALPFCIVFDIFTFGFLLSLGDFIMFLGSYRAWSGTKQVLKVVSPKKKASLFVATKSDFLRDFVEKSKGELTEQDLGEVGEFCREEEVGKTINKLRNHFETLELEQQQQQPV